MKGSECSHPQIGVKEMMKGSRLIVILLDENVCLQQLLVIWDSLISFLI